MMMSTLSRNTPVQFNRKTEEYEDETRREATNSYHRSNSLGWRMFSTRRSSQNPHHDHQLMMLKSFSYRRDRARKRQIFLQTYKLGESVNSRRKLRTLSMEKMGVKVKSVVVSVLTFLRGGAFRSCRSRPSVPASSPSRVLKFC